MTSTLLVADATNLSHRCWYSSGRTDDPAPVVAMVSSFLESAAAMVSASSVLAVFDGPDAGKSRYDVYPEYKAGRAPKDPALSLALAGVPDGLSGLGHAVVGVPFIEADDVLAHYAREFSPTVLMTSDKDALGLLVHEHVSLLRVSSGGPSNWSVVSMSSLQGEVGVAPGDYVLYAALVGDTSDNIPGAPKVGPGFAAPLAAHFHSVDAFLADVDSGCVGIAEALAPVRAGGAKARALAANAAEVSRLVRLSAELAAPVAVSGLPSRDSLLRVRSLSKASSPAPDSDSFQESSSARPSAAPQSFDLF